MKVEDFWNLKVDQLIWYQGKKFIIDSLTRSRWSGKKTISIYGNLTGEESDKNYDYYFEDICAECSLEAPKEKRRFYRWAIIDSKGNPYCPDTMLDENGNVLNGGAYINDWNNLKKKKDESFFWEE